MRTLALTVALLALVPSQLVAAERPSARLRLARAVARPFVVLKSWSKHNARADRDERLSLGEFLRFRKSGIRPPRVEARQVLETKIERASTVLARLRIAASSGARSHALGYPGALNEMFDGAYSTLNRLSASVYDAWSYAARRNLNDPRIRQLATEATAAMRWHISAEPRGANSISEFGAIFQGAKQSYQDLSAIAAGQFRGY